MKKSLFVAAVAALALVACDKKVAEDAVNSADSAVSANVDSLNLSNAVAISCYEILRQKLNK